MDYFYQRYNVIVRFRGKRDYYIAAYRYVKRDDKEVYHGVNRPGLQSISSPKTKMWIADNLKKKSNVNASSATCNNFL